MRILSYLLICTIFASVPCAAAAQNTPQIAITNANWTATDDLGRVLPSYSDVGGPKPNRWVGLFYWQWHGDLRALPDYNITEWMKTHPGFKDWVAHPEGGPHHPTWYWAEPLFGYYRSTDPWVMRKHLVMLADAGVDFLFMDYTNASVYDAELKAFLDVARDLKSKGVRVPKLTFFLNHEPDWKAEWLYKHWYKPGKYDDMWFKWDGKPLMMSPMPTDPAKLKDPSLLAEMQGYYTWRQTWALHDAAKEPTKWRFIDGHPQRPALGPDGKVEQIVVCKSMGGPLWDNMKVGGVSCVPGYEPVYNDQWVSKDCAKGLYFQEQWKVAQKVAPPMLLVTGWNEWTASVWETETVVFLGRKTGKGQGHIVDEFNMEFNRDLEPMKGGYNDNYYLQFVANMRRYKGMQAPEKPSGVKAARIDGKFDEWGEVRPVFRDAVGDIANRDFDGTVKGLHYTDESARNDIAFAQVARDSDDLFFHVRTASPLSPSTDANWMMLLLDADANPKTGWHGYDFLINRRRDGGKCSVERNVGGGWNWRVVAYLPVKWSGCDLELGLPRILLGLADGGVKIDFKWVDNIPEKPSVMDFYSFGDAAPGGRFSYRYETLN